MNKLKLFISKFLFLNKITQNLADLFVFIRESKKYSRLYKTRNFKFSKLPKEVQYSLKLYKNTVPLYIRTYSGDYDIFYEVFWEKVYNIPQGFLKEPQVIIDLGANVGFTSLFYALNYPDALIIGIEPERNNFQQAQINTRSFKNIMLKNVAISDENKKISLTDSDLSYNFRISNSTSGIGELEAITVDELIVLYNISRIDLIKIDIEGEEKNILKNNNHWLSKVDNIIIELHNPYTSEDLERDLLPYGFITYPKGILGNKIIYATKLKY